MNARRQARLETLCATDRPLWEQGVVFAGMDEAGRGPLAGNVVAACVVMPPEPLIEWVDDSKKLSEKRRDEVYEEILRIARYVGVGMASPEEIDRVNILNATKAAMKQAAAGAKAQIYLIVTGRCWRRTGCIPCTALRGTRAMAPRNTSRPCGNTGPARSTAGASLRISYEQPGRIGGIAGGGLAPPPGL